MGNACAFIMPHRVTMTEGGLTKVDYGVCDKFVVL